jgi:hypothetical protein
MSAVREQANRALPSRTECLTGKLFYCPLRASLARHALITARIPSNETAFL